MLELLLSPEITCQADPSAHWCQCCCIERAHPRQQWTPCAGTTCDLSCWEPLFLFAIFSVCGLLLLLFMLEGDVSVVFAGLGDLGERQPCLSSQIDSISSPSAPNVQKMSQSILSASPGYKGPQLAITLRVGWKHWSDSHLSEPRGKQSDNTKILSMSDSVCWPGLVYLYKICYSESGFLLYSSIVLHSYLLFLKGSNTRGRESLAWSK